MSRRRQSTPPRGMPHIYKQDSGMHLWVVRVYNPIIKRVQAYKSSSFNVVCAYARASSKQ